MKSSLISIIIPTYNRANLIKETLISIKNQSYSNFECIIVDDGSADNSDDVIPKLIADDQRFSYVKRPNDLPKGANACRNYGFKISKGDFINWFDSDDIMLSNKLEKQIALLKCNKDAPFVLCQTSWYDTNLDKDIGLRARKLISEKPFEDYILYNIFWSILAPLWRKSFLVRNNIVFDESLHQSQEYDFHIRALALDSSYCITQDILVQMCQHSSNLSNSLFLDNDKIKSNLYVKNRVTNQYLKEFSKTGKLKWLEILTLFYKNLLTHKKIKLAKKTIKIIYTALRFIEKPTYVRLFFFGKILLSLVSFVVFGRGYNLVKPIR